MKIIKQIFLFGIAFLCTMIFSEFFIRAAHIASVSSTEFYDDIGRGKRKNLSFLYFNEGFGINKFNEYRYIGEANPPEKPKNTIRIALLGDSYVESFQVFERDYFGNIAENILINEYPKRKFEFLNFGRSGFDIANMYSYQKSFIELFNPDFIVYMLSNADLEPRNRDPLIPKVKLRNDSLVVSLNFVASDIKMFERTKFFTQNFIILNMLNECRRKIKSVPIQAILLEKIYKWFKLPHLEMEYQYGKNSTYRINPVTQKIVETLDSNKVIFINRDMLELPGEYLKLCNDNGISFFDLSQVLNSMKKSGIDPVGWKVTGKKGHWNKQAHSIVGSFLANKIKILIFSTIPYNSDVVKLNNYSVY